MSGFVSSEDALSVDEFDNESESFDLQTKERQAVRHQAGPARAVDFSVNVSGKLHRSQRSASTSESPTTSWVGSSRPLFVAPSNGPRSIGNFHDYYLELGQWPELSPEKQAEVASKYTLVKQEYTKNLGAIQELEGQT